MRKKACIRCGECVAACPVDAVFRSRDGEVFICIHCGQCVDFCPHNCLALEERDLPAGEARP